MFSYRSQRFTNRLLQLLPSKQSLAGQQHRLIMTKSSNISFEYIPIEGNSLAHSLAEETLKRKDEIYLIGGVPEYAEHLKDRDKEDGMD
ncbi:hypothetical protein GOBAR_DD07176 [Gossypium barbadense]|nr:hypothetical protein GOBAR_DD07176 [Gossypium barbadense]